MAHCLLLLLSDDDIFLRLLTLTSILSSRHFKNMKTFASDTMPSRGEAETVTKRKEAVPPCFVPLPTTNVDASQRIFLPILCAKNLLRLCIGSEKKVLFLFYSTLIRVEKE